MAKKVYVMGHRNPDNDSICSAVAYAYLKNETARTAMKNGKKVEYFYEPVRLGPMPAETEWLFKKYKIEIPRALRHVYGRVRDVMSRDLITARDDETVMDAGRRMRQNKKKALIVVDKKGNYKGIISTRMIANRYISSTDKIGKNGENMALVAADLVQSLGEKVGDLMETDVLHLTGEDLLKDATDRLLSSKIREAVILDDKGEKCIGVITRSDVARRLHKDVILVDHNEASQAAVGITEANIMEIVDHHRIADLSTLMPIKFVNLPVGSTASIVASEFQNYKHKKMKIPKGIAAILLSAILTDTIILNSPTTTAYDQRIAKDLAKIAEVDIQKFGKQIFTHRGGEEEMDIKDLVFADSKEFQLGDSKILIAQHETVNVKKVMKREDEIRRLMSKVKKDREYEFVLYLLTDIIEQGSLFIATGNLDILNRMFGISCHGKGGT